MVADGQRTTGVRNALDTNKLLSYINAEPSILATLESIRRAKSAVVTSANTSGFLSRLEAKQFGFGQSNPTYLLTGYSESVNDIETYTYKFVMRKKPESVAHPTAHNVAREHKLLRALQIHNTKLKQYATPRNRDKSVPIPTPINLCQDKSVLGTDFYLMDFVEGRIFTDASMPGMTNKERGLAWRDAVRVLGNIHDFDFVNSGLGKQKSRQQQVPSLVKSIHRLLSVYEAQSVVAGKISSLPNIGDQLIKMSGNAPGGGGSLLNNSINEKVR